ncbi:MAG: hypothetical protein J6Y48_20305, partial [Clostridia bacterium]|nr:hypothetical protein [Clostridia bacterium]
MNANLNNALFNVSGAGKLILKGGNVSNRGQVAVASDGGEVIVENGSYVSTKAAVFRATVRGKVTVNAGELTGQEGAIDCWGKGSDNKCGAEITM